MTAMRAPNTNASFGSLLPMRRRKADKFFTGPTDLSAQVSKLNVANDCSSGDIARRWLLGLALVALATTYARAQSQPPRDTNVVLRVSILGGERPFRIGETIPIQLAFSTTIGNRYQINMASYDRSGRMEYEHFRVFPSDGSVDPLTGRRGGIMGGITSFDFLASKPWPIQLNLNEWVRFTRPGTYRLEITSDRVERRNREVVGGMSHVEVVANPITLTIVPPTAAWQKATFDSAVAVLDQPAPEKPDGDRYYHARLQALDTLRFLGSPEAIRELVKRLGSDPAGDSICVLGLISAPDPAIALEALDVALADPARAIDSRFMSALQSVGQEPAQWQQSRQQAIERLVAVLPKKRDRALSISLATAANEAWNFAPVSASTTDALVRQLIARFDELPIEHQAMLLDGRWDKIASPALLPIVRRYAEAFDNQLNSNSPSGSAAYRLRTSALRHWYELDPMGAREAILAEITRPYPRYSARTLGFLADKELPDVDAILAKHFIESDDFNRSDRIASLIARYATSAILTPVLTKIDQQLAKSACGVPRAILAYTLRANPALARPRIEKIRATRDFPACYRDLLTTIADIHYDPILEDLAVRGLDDPDREVRDESAKLLGEFGSPRAESILFERYRRWSAQWTGREAVLNPASADRYDVVNEGAALLGALTTGQSWLTNAKKLQSLLPVAKGARLRQMLDADLKTWNKPALTVWVNYGSGSLPLEAGVVQYRVHSMQALEDKLEQFPTRTTFELRLAGPDSPARRASDARLNAFLADHGMIVVPAK